MIQIFGTKKCKDTRRAERFFKERGADFQFRDMAIKPPSPGELDDIAGAAGGYEALLDLSGAAATKRGLAHLVYDARDLLLEDAALYRTPIVRAGKGKAAVGADEKAWRGFLDG